MKLTEEEKKQRKKEANEKYRKQQKEKQKENEDNKQKDFFLKPKKKTEKKNKQQIIVQIPQETMMDKLKGYLLGFIYSASLTALPFVLSSLKTPSTKSQTQPQRLSNNYQNSVISSF